MHNGVTLDLQPQWFLDWPDGDDIVIAEVLAKACEVQALANLYYLKCHPYVRRMYETPIRYIAEPAQPIAFLGIPTIAAQGGSDCKNLVAWRLAEIWRDEEKPKPHGYGERRAHVKTYWKTPPPGSKLRRIFHAEIRLPAELPNGERNPETVEDVSRYLGM